jgi:hypothetical protein
MDPKKLERLLCKMEDAGATGLCNQLLQYIASYAQGTLPLTGLTVLYDELLKRFTTGIWAKGAVSAPVASPKRSRSPRVAREAPVRTNPPQPPTFERVIDPSLTGKASQYGLEPEAVRALCAAVALFKRARIDQLTTAAKHARDSCSPGPSAVQRRLAALAVEEEQAHKRLAARTDHETTDTAAANDAVRDANQVTEALMLPSSSSVATQGKARYAAARMRQKEHAMHKNGPLVLPWHQAAVLWLPFANTKLAARIQLGFPLP